MLRFSQQLVDRAAAWVERAQALVEPGAGIVSHDAPLAWRQLARDHLQQGRLAAAVRAGDADALPAADHQADRAQGRSGEREFDIGQLGDAALGGGGDLRRVQAHGAVFAQALRSLAHALVQLPAHVLMLLAQAAVAVFAALLLPSQQDPGLVGGLALAGSLRLAALLAFVLLAHGALLALQCLARVVDVAQGIGLFGGARLGIEINIAAVAAQALRRELDDALHLAQQGAVVADHDQAAPPSAQLGRQGLAARAVEVVGGLVEDQEVRVGEHGAQQRHAHRFAAAQPAGGRGGAKVAKAGLLEGVAQARGQVPAFADQREVAFCDAAGVDARQGVEHVLHTGQRGHRAFARLVDLLREVVHPALADAAAGGRRQYAGQQLCQHALADAVAADQAGVARIKLFSEPGQQGETVGKNERCAVERQVRVRH